MCVALQVAFWPSYYECVYKLDYIMHRWHTDKTTNQFFSYGKNECVPQLPLQLHIARSRALFFQWIPTSNQWRCALEARACPGAYSEISNTRAVICWKFQLNGNDQLKMLRSWSGSKFQASGMLKFVFAARRDKPTSNDFTPGWLTATFAWAVQLLFNDAPDYEGMIEQNTTVIRS